MDGQTLQQLFSGSNPFLAQMGEKAFNLDQQKRQADLASIMGQEQRAQQMLPLEMEQKRQAARMSGGQADLYADQIASKPPAEDRRKAAMQEMLAKMDETTKAQFKAQVTRNMQIAAMAKANKGALPPGLQLSPEEMQMFDPKNLDAIIQHGKTFLEFDPEEIAKRQRASEQMRLEQERQKGRIDLKNTPTAGSGGAKTTDPGLAKMNLEQQYGYWNNLAARETDEAKKAQYQAEADRIELVILRKVVNAATANKAGNVDPVATANNPEGNIVARPPANPQPTPRNNVAPTSGSPAQSRTVKMKATNGTTYDVPANQVQAAKARGWTE